MSAKPVMVSAGVLQRESCLRTLRRGPRARPSRACAVVKSLRTGLESGGCRSLQLAREDFEGDGVPSREEPGPWSLQSLMCKGIAAQLGGQEAKERAPFGDIPPLTAVA